MGESCIVEEEAIRLMDNLDPDFKGRHRPIRRRGMDHGTTGVGASEPLPCMHQTDTFGLVGLRWVGHFSVLGPDEEVTLTTREAGFFIIGAGAEA